MTPIDIITILGANLAITSLMTGIIMWFMAGIKTDIQNIRVELQDMRNELRSVNLRVARIEGAITNKECCMIKPARDLERVE